MEEKLKIEIDITGAAQNARTILSLLRAIKNEAKEVKKLFESGALAKSPFFPAGGLSAVYSGKERASGGLLDIPNSKQKTDDVLQIFTKLKNELASGFERALSITRSIDGILGTGASKIVQGFQTALSITQSIVQLINTISTFASLLSFIPGVGAIGALQHGGQVNKARLYQWSERGRELFISTSGGYVLDSGTFSSFASAAGMFAQLMEREREYMTIASVGRYSRPGDVYISANLDSLRFFKTEQPKYGKYAKIRRK